MKLSQHNLGLPQGQRTYTWFFISILGWLFLAAGAFYYSYVADRGPGVPLGDGSASQIDGSANLHVEEVARGLEVPWSIAFTSPTRMLVTERPGRLRVIENGVLRDQPLHTFLEASSIAEEGLMSVVVDPDYERNRFIYVSVAYMIPPSANGGMTEQGMGVKIVRFKDSGSSLSEETVILDGIPAARFHAGNRLAFGPDGKLYSTTGDATDRQLAQGLESLAGKILRINADGSIPNDNPFPNNPVWSYGHRNPQGIDWDENGRMYSSEHGPSVFDGPRGGDEVNLIIKGANYGWPLVSHEESREGTEPALEVFTPAEAPASLLVYTADEIPQFKGNIFFGALIGEGIVRFIPNSTSSFSNGGTKGGFTIEKNQNTYGRIREVMQGPDGFIYFTTSNRDGRGNPQDGDDKIYRIRPAH